MDLNGKVALITGSGRGIGKAIATVLAKHGADIVISDIDNDSAVKTSQEIESLGKKSIAVEGDVSQKSDVEKLIAEAVNKMGKVDILVNNAGIIRDSLIDKMEEAAWYAVLGVNLKSAFLATQAIIPVFRENKYGRVVNISSKAGWVGNVGQANYTASKAGMLGLTLTTAKEFGRFVVREQCDLTCNAIMPGVIDTPMTQSVPEKAMQYLLSNIPLNRAGQPEDVGNAVLFLCSEYARYINGVILPVDGGFMMAL